MGLYHLNRVRNDGVIRGPMRIGSEDGTSYTQIAADGTITLVGDATVFDHIRIAATATRVGALAAPGFAQLLDDGSGSVGVFAFQFDKASEEQIHFVAQLPHTWREGTDIRPHVHWCPTDTDTGAVVWGLEYSWSNIGSVFGNSTLVTATQAGSGATHDHHMIEFDAISATDKTHSGILLCRLYRKAADAADTYDNDAALLEIDFHYEIDRLGDSVN